MNSLRVAPSPLDLNKRLTTEKTDDLALCSVYFLYSLKYQIKDICSKAMQVNHRMLNSDFPHPGENFVGGLER